MKSVKDEGIVTQLAVVATMMPKVKEYIDQQADRIAELEKRPAINKEDGLVCAKCYGSLIPKPLSDEEILQFKDKVPYSYSKDLLDFARAIEERHGIK